MLHGLGVATGVDVPRLLDAADYITAALGRPSSSPEMGITVASGMTGRLLTQSRGKSGLGAGRRAQCVRDPALDGLGPVLTVCRSES